MDKGREGWELERSAQPLTAAAVVTQVATEAPKCRVEAWGAKGHEVSRGAARQNPLA